jgi:hypothetical protein
MLRKIRVTPSMAVAVVALVFAATGGALAATSDNNGVSHTGSLVIAKVSKAKAKTKAGPRGPAGPAGKNGAPGAAGPAGPAGPAGATGPAGAAGPVGSAGTDGTNGTNGKEGKEGPEGPEGSPWTVGGRLPSGQSESGTWAVRRTDNAPGEKVAAALSYGIRLAVAPEEVNFIAINQALPPGCKGSAAEPEALPGNLCIFEGAASFSHKGGLLEEVTLSPTGGAAGTTGAEVILNTQQPVTPGEEVSAEGTWVVTAK